MEIRAMTLYTIFWAAGSIEFLTVQVRRPPERRAGKER